MAAAPLFVGLMSGTSLDGIDAALVDLSALLPRTCATFWLPYASGNPPPGPATARPQENEIAPPRNFGKQLAHCYAQAVSRPCLPAGIDPAQVAAIGCHGQTIRHQPAAGYSMQLNNPALLAELAGITVVADFRSRDMPPAARARRWCLLFMRRPSATLCSTGSSSTSAASPT
jgi:anhydro-N-acetylmuramic acid kinase